MLKKQSVIFQTLTFISFSYILGACTPDPKTPNESQNISCEEHNSCLVRNTKNSTLMFKTEHLFVEQLIPFTIRSNKPLESVYLVATNMNMGRLPVRLNKLTKTETQAEVFFGMCAEPMMSWNVILTYQDGTQEITDLKSYWNQRAIQ